MCIFMSTYGSNVHGHEHTINYTKKLGENMFVCGVRMYENVCVWFPR